MVFFCLKSVKYAGSTALGQEKQLWPWKVIFIKLNTISVGKYWNAITHSLLSVQIVDIGSPRLN